MLIFAYFTIEVGLVNAEVRKRSRQANYSIKYAIVIISFICNIIADVEILNS